MSVTILSLSEALQGFQVLLSSGGGNIQVLAALQIPSFPVSTKLRLHQVFLWASKAAVHLSH